MDHAQTLIRSTARAFYDKKQVLIVDALIIHSVLAVEDLSLVLTWQRKEVRKLAGKLKEDRLIASHTRQEQKEGALRASGQEYYYINLHEAVDAIKYKVFNLTRKIQEMYKAVEERKDYKCPRCKAAYTEMEVLDKRNDWGLFACGRCGEELDRDDPDDNSGGSEMQSKLAAQVEPLMKLFKLIDKAGIPNKDFESLLSGALAVERDESINPLRPVTVGDGARGPLVTVKGVAQAAAPLEISLTTNSEKTAEEQAADAKRKEAIAQQNMLPDWMARSTVTGEATAVGLAEWDRMVNNAALGTTKVEEDEKNDKLQVENDLTALYAQIAADKAKEEAEAAMSDDDEDEFEEVIGSTSDGTPSSSAPAAINGGTNGLYGELVKAQIADSSSSNPGTGTSTPGDVKRQRDGEERSPAKKVKLEAPDSAVLEDKASPGNQVSDEDEEEEFEDAL